MTMKTMTNGEKCAEARRIVEATRYQLEWAACGGAGGIPTIWELIDKLEAVLGADGYTCGATGGPCDREKRADGSFPCDGCQVGTEFRKSWEGQPNLMDD